VILKYAKQTDEINFMLVLLMKMFFYFWSYDIKFSCVQTSRELAFESQSASFLFSTYSRESRFPNMQCV
jgi:hypothetical protein